MEDVYKDSRSKIMTVGDWLITILITAIPVVGLVMLFVWAFGDNQNESKANWAKANLIWMAIMIAFVFVIWAIIFAVFGYQFMDGDFD